jgi:hypothetical protein
VLVTLRLGGPYRVRAVTHIAKEAVMRHTVTTSVKPTAGDTLAAWVRALSLDSPCFCCGSPLDNLPVEAIIGDPAHRGLSCSHCGAGVFGEDDPLEDLFVADAALDHLRPALVAA